MSTHTFRTATLLVALLFATQNFSANAQTADLSEIKAGQYDNGKMWTFDYPPVQHLKETYDFEPDAAWFDKARLGSLRLPNCTASFVSPNGLVMTNNHCGRSSVTQVSQVRKSHRFKG